MKEYSGMKKLFALLLTLAMIFALAAPALASGWDAIPDVKEDFEEITVSITALETEKNTSVLGSLYEELSVMYPVVKGTLVHFFVEITIPGDLSPASAALLTGRGLKYALVLTNLEITEAYSYENGASRKKRAPADTELADDTDLIADTAKCVYGYEYWAEGVKPGEASASATVGFYNEWYGSGSYRTMNIDSDGDGDTDCYAEHYLPGYTGSLGSFADHSHAWFSFWSGAGADYCYMWFPVDSTSGKVLASLEIFMETNEYGDFAITRSVADDITFRDLSSNVIYTPADTTGVYAALKAKYDATFKKLGFSYEGANYISEKHFEKYFGTIIEKTVKITYPSGAVVVSPPSVEPPQTGDAGTLVGFVMIALALAAAGYALVRKVRA